MMRERSGSGSESSEFRRAISMMKQGLELICDLSDEMEERYSERDGYRERDNYHERDNYPRSYSHNRDGRDFHERYYR